MFVSAGPEWLFPTGGRGNLEQKPNFGETVQLVCSHTLQSHYLAPFCSAGLCGQYMLVHPSASPIPPAAHSPRPRLLLSGGAKGPGQRRAESSVAREHVVSHLGRGGRTFLGFMEVSPSSDEAYVILQQIMISKSQK